MSLNSLYGPDPPEPDGVECPSCGEFCEMIYIDENNIVFGCENCITDMDSWDWAAFEAAGREAEIGDRKYHQMKDERIN